MNCQVVEYKEQLNEVDTITFSSESLAEEESSSCLSSDHSSSVVLSSELENESGSRSNTRCQVKFTNQSLFLHVWNEINELNRYVIKSNIMFYLTKKAKPIHNPSDLFMFLPTILLQTSSNKKYKMYSESARRGL